MHSSLIPLVNKILSHEETCLFLMYFWTLNSNIFPESSTTHIFCSRSKGWNLLRQDSKVCFYRGRHEEFKDFFSQKDGGVFCSDVCSVMEVLGLNITQISGACLFIRQK